MKKLITILFGVMIMSLVSCGNMINDYSDGTVEINGGNEGGNGGETTTVTFEDYTYNLIASNTSYNLTVNSTANNNKFSLHKSGETLVFTYKASLRQDVKATFYIGENTMTYKWTKWDDHTYDKYRTIEIDNNNKVVTITLDHRCFY